MGSYKFLPVMIKEECSFCINFSRTQKRELMCRLNNHIKYQLTSSTLPNKLKLIEIGKKEHLKRCFKKNLKIFNTWWWCYMLVPKYRKYI
jgi:hypothetical protein